VGARAAQPAGANRSLDELGVEPIIERITRVNADTGIPLAQCTRREYAFLLSLLRAQRCAVAACNGIRVLVFGSGHDTPAWIAANDGPGAVTAVIEEDPAWVEFAAGREPPGGAPHVLLARYRSASRALLTPVAPPADAAEAAWALRGHSPFEPGYVLTELMADLAARHGPEPWDFIFVDGPLGWKHGRMGAYATAALLASQGGVVAGHDMQRCLEGYWARAYFSAPGAAQIHAAPGERRRDATMAFRVLRPPPPSWEALVAGILGAATPPSPDEVNGELAGAQGDMARLNFGVAEGEGEGVAAGSA
jgi:hypothetical protein